MVKVKQDLVLIKPEDIKPSSPEFEILGTFNPGVVRLASGDILVYVRVWERLKKTQDNNFCYSPRMCGTDKYNVTIDKFNKELIENATDLDFLFKDGTKRFTFISHLRRVLLDRTGMKIKTIDDKPSFYGLEWDGELGVEDPRITKIGDLYVMTYVSLSRKENISTSYAISNDCINWYRRGVIFSEQNKDVVLFPELINNEYIAIERPEGNLAFALPRMWIVYSKDMELWGRQHPLIIFKKGDWDVGKVGAGPPPIKTEKGWLLIYHGVLNFKKRKVIDKIIDKMQISETMSGTVTSKDTIYCAGALLFDLANPKKLIAKTDVPILFPMKKHEIANFGNLRVIFPTGLVMDENKRDLLIYSGAGDRITTVKKVSLKKIMKKLRAVEPAKV